MKTPDEVRADLNAAREAYRNRWGLLKRFGMTSPPTLGMNESRLQEAADDDRTWELVLDAYVEDYERYFYPYRAEQAHD
jgi:hypothetical protein